MAMRRLKEGTMRVKNGVEPINHTADTARGGSRPKPPKAVAQRASLEAPGAVSEHQTAKRRLTAKTVAFLFLAASRMRISPCDTVARLCVRSVCN